MKTAMVLLSLFCGTLSFAQESNESRYGWEASIGAGLTLWPKSHVTVKQGSNSLGSVESNDKSSPQIGIEVGKFLSEHFKLSALGLWSQYKYDSGSESDTEIAFFLMPKYYRHYESSRLWFGLGLGFVNTSFGSTSGTSNGVTVTTDSSSTMAFAFSPSVGYEIDICDDCFIGFQANYISGNATIDVTATISGTPVKLKEDYSRSWYGALVYIGTRFE